MKILSIDDHAKISRRSLDRAGILLEKGKHSQAAEKVWNAAAHALKAVGKQRGWAHDSNFDIFSIGEHLGKELGKEEEFYGCLAHAERMRLDFWGTGWSEMSIRGALSDVKWFVDELERIRNSPPRPFTVTDDEDRIRLGRLLGLRRSERPPLGDYSPVGYSQTHSTG